MSNGITGLKRKLRGEGRNQRKTKGGGNEKDRFETAKNQPFRRKKTCKQPGLFEGVATQGMPLGG